MAGITLPTGFPASAPVSTPQTLVSPTFEEVLWYGVPGIQNDVVAPPSESRPNEPSGMQTIFDFDCSTLPETQSPKIWNSDFGTGTNLVLDTNPPVVPPLGAGTTWRLRFPTTHNTSAGYAPAEARRFIDAAMAGMTEMYLEFDMFISSNWQAHRQFCKCWGTWLHFGWSEKPGGHMGIFTQVVSTNGVPLGSSFSDHVNAPLEYSVWTQSIADGDTGSENQHAHGATAIQRGRWHKFEHYFKMDSMPGASDAIIRWWLDGSLGGEATSDDLVNATQPKTWGKYSQLAPYYGGGASDPIVEDCYWWFDHIYVSGK